MRNSSLVKRFCAENVTGLKLSTEATDREMVGERCVGDTSVTERTRAANTSENVGMSSVKYVRTIFPECLRFPTEGQSASG